MNIIVSVSWHLRSSMETCSSVVAFDSSQLWVSNHSRAEVSMELLEMFCGNGSRHATCLYENQVAHVDRGVESWARAQALMHVPRRLDEMEDKAKHGEFNTLSPPLPPSGALQRYEGLLLIVRYIMGWHSRPRTRQYGRVTNELSMAYLLERNRPYLMGCSSNATCRR